MDGGVGDPLDQAAELISHDSFTVLSFDCVDVQTFMRLR